jgi:hypothetical protein
LSQRLKVIPRYLSGLPADDENGGWAEIPLRHDPVLQGGHLAISLLPIRLPAEKGKPPRPEPFFSKKKHCASTDIYGFINAASFGGG